MPASSRVGAATDALLALLRARAELAQVDISDGPPLEWGQIRLSTPQKGDGHRFLFVGASPDSDLAAESAMTWNAAGAVSRDERFSIVCSAVGWTGDLVTKTARDIAVGLIASVEAAVRADPTIGQTVLYSEVSSIERLDYQQRDDRGLSAVAVFRVSCRAYLS